MTGWGVGCMQWLGGTPSDPISHAPTNENDQREQVE
jgi:hypothetical protein